jgi:hypothetical protein
MILATILTLVVLLPIPFIGEIIAPILAADVAIFIAISIPTAIVAAFVLEVLNIQVSPIPSLCFDKETVFTLKNGSKKTIENLDVGDILEQNEVVTAKIKVHTSNSVMYNLNNVIVSGCHTVLHENKWIRVENHPEASKIEEYLEPFLYCLNTSSKKIIVNNTIFCDWDEIYGEKLDNLILESDLIHKFLDGGFVKETLIPMKNGLKKKISDVIIGDVLKGGSKVYGIVEINGSDLFNQYIYNLGNNNSFSFEGGVNLIMVMKDEGYFSTKDLNHFCKKERSLKDKKLYHLLVDKKTFFVNNTLFYDYNSCIDLFF